MNVTLGKYMKHTFIYKETQVKLSISVQPRSRKKKPHKWHWEITDAIFYCMHMSECKMSSSNSRVDGRWEWLIYSTNLLRPPTFQWKNRTTLITNSYNFIIGSREHCCLWFWLGHSINGLLQVEHLFSIKNVCSEDKQWFKPRTWVVNLWLLKQL